MSVRNAEISGILIRWLERYSPPANIRENARAQQDEANALLSVLLRFAPQDGAGDWVARALDRLEYQMKTRAWPTKGELGSVCSILRKEGPRVVDLTAPDQDDASRAARRIAAGEPVGDGWLWGIQAHELLGKGEVTEGQLNAYRSALKAKIRAIYVSEQAERMIRDLDKRHEDARKMLAGAGADGPRSRVHIPDKRATPPESCSDQSLPCERLPWSLSSSSMLREFDA